MGLFFPVMVVGSIASYIGLKKLKEYSELGYTIRSSVLFAFLTKGNMLMRVDRGKVNDMYFDLYMTMAAGPLFGEPIAPGGSVIYRLEIPFSTQGHLVGISNKNHTAKAASINYIKQNKMERVDLEGDFNNYFSLFCASGQQTHARYIFDPAAMQFVADFCANHDWEIVYDELYFTISQDQKGGEIINKSIDFIKQVKPAIIKEFPTKEALKKKTPYGEWRGDPMPCPICQANMNYYVNWHECPSGHGRLVHAQKLVGFRKGHIKTLPPIANTKITERQTSLDCPHCNNKMVQTQYAQAGLYIDSCPKCPYRWFDAGELAKIMQTK